MSRASIPLLLGLAATVAVAWGSVFTHPEPRRGIPRKYPDTLQAIQLVYHDWGGRSCYLVGIPDIQQLRAASEVAKPGDPLWVQAIDWTAGSEQRGWPWFAVSSKIVVARSARVDPEWLVHWRSRLRAGGSGSSTRWEHGAMPGAAPLPVTGPVEARGALLVGSRKSSAARRDVGAVVLPYTPIWTGLLPDTLFYAALFAGFHHLAARLCRARRRLRGLCPRCGYDLTGIDGVCPECGGLR